MTRKKIAIIAIIILVLIGFILIVKPFGPGRAENIVSDPSAYTFEYPDDIGNEYAAVSDWPPTLEIVDGPMGCVETSTNVNQGRITVKKINEERVCLIEKREDFEGDLLTKYFYTIERDSYVFVYGFSIREKQCDTIEDEQQMSACNDGQSQFEADVVAEELITSTEIEGKRVW